VAKAEQAK